MKDITKRFGLASMIFAAAAGLIFAASAFAQESPAPGTTIDKSNIAKYAHLFPEQFLPAFENGFDGLIKPIHVNVVETQPRAMYKPFVEYSMKNKGKYTLDAEGYPGPGYTRDGLPFPDLKPGDPDFATKLMWNFEVRYQYDESFATAKGASFKVRKGEKLQWTTSHGIDVRFKNRMVLSPKPMMDNPEGVYYAFLYQYLSPVSLRNTMTLTYRYADPKKPDNTWLYLPSMRRVIRAEAGQRSTPVVGSISALDDFNGFDGRISDFTYSFVKEQKVIAITDDKLNHKTVGKRSELEDLPFAYDNYEVRDVYVVDIIPKDPKYPQSKKRVYLDRDTLSPYYAIAWDRAGKIWKVFFMTYRQYPLGNGSNTQALAGYFGIDVQFGMATNWISDFRVNENNFTWGDVTPSSLIKRGR